MKWAFRYLTKLPKPPSSKSQATGSEIHRQVEQLLKGQPANHGAANALYLLTKDLLPGQVEYHFKVSNIQGYIDFVGEGVVVDHKTTKDLKYAMTMQELQDDLQAIIYAHWYFGNCDADEVRCRWQYVETKTPYKTKVVECTLTRQHVETKMGEVIWPLIDRAEEIRAGKQPQKNLFECHSWGGCPYQKECSMGLLEELRVGVDINPPPEVKPNTDTDDALVEGLQRMSLREVDPKTIETLDSCDEEDTIGFLFIDCFGRGMDIEDAYTYFYDLQKDMPNHDYTSIEFGKGKVLFREKVRKHLAENPVAALYLNSRTQFGQDMIPELSRLAGVVIKPY